MSESEPKVKTIYVCPQCGWQRPKGFSSHNCGKCNATLMPKIVKVVDCAVDPDELQLMDECNKPWVQAWKKATDCELDPAHYIKGFTEEYRNRNWHKCRYQKDLRNCLEYHSKNVNGKLVIFCKADNQPCNAKWMGDKE